MSAAAENSRLIGDVVRLGTIADVDLAAARCVVDVGDIKTGPLPWLTGRAGRTRIWSPPSIGEQVILLCPEGDAAAGVVIPGIFSDSYPAPSGLDVDIIRFDDGTFIAYDADTHHLEVILAGGGSMQVDAPGGIAINGDITLTGSLTASDDVVAGGISLNTHKHGGVQAGGAQTGTPV